MLLANIFSFSHDVLKISRIFDNLICWSSLDFVISIRANMIFSIFTDITLIQERKSVMIKFGMRYTQYSSKKQLRNCQGNWVHFFVSMKN